MIDVLQNLKLRPWKPGIFVKQNPRKNLKILEIGGEEGGGGGEETQLKL